MVDNTVFQWEWLWGMKGKDKQALYGCEGNSDQLTGWLPTHKGSYRSKEMTLNKIDDLAENNNGALIEEYSAMARDAARKIGLRRYDCRNHNLIA